MVEISVSELMDTIDWHMNNALASLATQNPERAKLGLLSAGIAQHTAELALQHMDELHGNDINKFRAARSRASDLVRSYWEDFQLVLKAQPGVKPTVADVQPGKINETQKRQYAPRIDAEVKDEILSLLKDGVPPDKTLVSWLNEIVAAYHVGFSTLSNWYYDQRKHK